MVWELASPEKATLPNSDSNMDSYQDYHLAIVDKKRFYLLQYKCKVDRQVLGVRDYEKWSLR